MMEKIGLLEVFDPDNWVDIAYGNGSFIMIAEGSNNVVYSTDGLTWTAALYLIKR